MSEKEQHIPVNHDIMKTPLSYIHTTKVTYPKENVEAMKKSWEESIQESRDFITHAKEARKSAEEHGIAQIEAESIRIQDRIKELSSLTKEERAESLLKEFDDFVAAEAKNLEMLEEKKKEYMKAINEEIENNLKHHRDNMQRKKDALKLWSNYRTE